MLDGSGRSVDICSRPRGGAACTSDAGCAQPGGLCIGGQCVCQDNFLCSDCRLTLTDLLYGLSCAVHDGGASCTSTATCGNGTCLQSPPSAPGFCQCQPGYACLHCDRAIAALAKNQTTCPEGAV